MDFLSIYLINLVILSISNLDVYVRNIPNFVSYVPQIAYLLAMALYSILPSCLAYIVYLFFKKGIVEDEE